MIDFNSNGQFNDESEVNNDVRSSNGTLYPKQGDMLLIDPASDAAGSPYDVTDGDCRQYVARLVNIDGRFYELKVSPTGDKLTLIATPLPLGSVTNPSENYRAVIYGERGFLKIRGAKGKPVPVPEGEWKLLSYTIDVSEPSKGSEQPSDRGLSAWSVVAGLLGGDVPVAASSCTIVCAQATGDYRPVNVREGATVALPFGPPYRPKVTATPVDDHQVSLALSLIGSSGEVCTNMIVAGHRPPKPELTITGPKGEVVQKGNFEYG